MPRLSNEVLFTRLACERQMTSLIDKAFIAGSDLFVFDKTNWVNLFYDPENVVTSDCGQVRAFRAITYQGDLLWFCFTNGKTFGYHALGDDPFVAIEEAQDAWRRRAYVKQRWDEVQSMARELIKGTQKFDVLYEDAEASPLCLLGIDGFLARIGMPKASRLSGRTAALLMKLEPQLGFVIFEAMQREGLTQGYYRPSLDMTVVTAAE